MTATAKTTRRTRPDAEQESFGLGALIFVDDQGALDLHGNPFRSKAEHPYSYSPIIIFDRKPSNPEKVRCAYSDRMRSWARDAGRDFHKDIAELFGPNVNDYFPTKSPKLVEQFIRKQFNKPELVLVRIVEECNMATGFPVWSIHYEDPTA